MVQKQQGTVVIRSQQQVQQPKDVAQEQNRQKQVLFAVLLPALLPQLGKDRAMQLHTLYGKLKENEISKGGFFRHMRDIVGYLMLRLVVNKLQVQVLGTDELNTYLNKYDLELDPVLDALLGSF